MIMGRLATQIAGYEQNIPPHSIPKAFAIDSTPDQNVSAIL